MKMTQDEVIALLKERGIVLDIGGCGCCGSPWVAIFVDGEEVFSDDGVSFSS